MAEKVTLEQMAEACQDEADHVRFMLKLHYELNPGSSPWPSVELEGLTFAQAAQTLRIMACYPDESRKFVAGLLKRYADGR